MIGFMSAPKEKNAAAVALGKKRWAGRSAAEKSRAGKHAAAARQKKVKPARRREIASLGGLARAAKRRAAEEEAAIAKNITT